jgi:hypothetical protein
MFKRYPSKGEVVSRTNDHELPFEVLRILVARLCGVALARVSW